MKQKTKMSLAYDDMYTAKLLLSTRHDEGLVRIAAYHTQQALEKTLKFILEENGEQLVKTHDLSILISNLDKIGISIPKAIIEIHTIVTHWESMTRYDETFKFSINEIIRLVKRVDKFTCSIGKEYNIRNNRPFIKF